VPTHRVVHELPFDSDRKRMTVVTLDPLGRELAHVKGSADVLLPLCVGRHTSNGIEPMSDAARRDILRVAEEYSRKGLRVLAIAHRELSAGRASGPDAHGLDSLEEELTFLGLVAMLDPPRDGVKGAVAECQRAGVGVVMITGDHPLTATAIASELGFWDEGALVVTGQDLTTMSDEALREKAPHVRVFARVTAEQKLRIVAAYKALGEVVAMTGDGVNDAPALREAHIGVALGQSGTHVAREAADMVIADDNFVTIVDAVREGRAIYRNIKKFIFFLLSANAGLVVAVFVGSLLPRVEPLTPLMILWINLVTNGLPALALGVDPPDARQMREPPRKTTEGLLGRREALGIGFVGLWMGLCALAFFYLPYTALASSAQCRALAFSLLALCPLAHALNCRSPRESLFVAKPFLPKALVICIFLSAAIHSVSILVPTLHPVFRTFPLTQSDVLWLGVLSLSILPAVELMKWIDRRTTWFGTT
jgi:Ca2+-transporting ATPase